MVSRQIKALAAYNGISLQKMSSALGVTAQTTSKKLKRDNMTESDMREMADALGADVKITFIDRKTGKEF